MSIVIRKKGSDALLDGIFRLIVFEALRTQVALGQGIACPLYHQYAPNCCGNAQLLWAIYEAGVKAAEELDWHPTW
jgi:hypothetical protein